MPGKDYLPHALALFHKWVVNFNHLLAGLEAGIPADVKAAICEKMERFMVLYAKTENPATARSVDIHGRDDVRRELEAALRTFIKIYIRNNPLLDEEVRNRMSVSVATGERHLTPVPATYPVLTVDTSKHRELIVHFRDAEEVYGKAKPAGVHGAEIKWALRDTLPASADELLHSNFDTRTPVVLPFIEGQRGARVCIAARWENTRGQKGPWSDMVMAVIP